MTAHSVWDNALTDRGIDGRPKDAPKAELFDYLVETATTRIYGPGKVFKDKWDNEVTRAELIEESARNWSTYLNGWINRIPAQYTTARVGNLDDTQHRDLIAGFPASEGATLFLAGPIGTGKSYAAWALGHEFASRRVVARGWSVPRLLVDMRPDGDPRAFDLACTADFLILDDIAAAKPTDWAVEQMYSIAEARTGNGLRTVVTTNGSYEALVQMWGEPTMDRFRHKSVTAVFEGKSRREPLW